jgi:hypothetical protein
MKFSEKNDFIVKHADGGEFHSDLELFKEHYPNDRLNHDLARANSITYRRLDGSMLLKLLDKVAPAEILAHRDATKKSERQRLEDERKAAEEHRRLDEIAEAGQQKKILAEAAEAALIEQQRLEKEAEDERRRLEEQTGDEQQSGDETAADPDVPPVPDVPATDAKQTKKKD